MHNGTAWSSHQGLLWIQPGYRKSCEYFTHLSDYLMFPPSHSGYVVYIICPCYLIPSLLMNIFLRIYPLNNTDDKSRHLYFYSTLYSIVSGHKNCKAVGPSVVSCLISKKYNTLIQLNQYIQLNCYHFVHFIVQPYRGLSK